MYVFEVGKIKKGLLKATEEEVQTSFFVVKKCFCDDDDDDVKTFVFSFLLITESVKKCKVSKSVK